MGALHDKLRLKSNPDFNHFTEPLNAHSLLMNSSYHPLTIHYPDISCLETAAKYSLGVP